jgi:hypothetical protein
MHYEVIAEGDADEGNVLSRDEAIAHDVAGVAFVRDGQIELVDDSERECVGIIGLGSLDHRLEIERAAVTARSEQENEHRVLHGQLTPIGRAVPELGVSSRTIAAVTGIAMAAATTAAAIAHVERRWYHGVLTRTGVSISRSTLDVSESPASTETVR